MPNPENDTPYKQCKKCSSLSTEEYGFQKYGWEDDSTYISAAAGHLIEVKDLKPGNTDRQLRLQQCPECKTYYLYRTDYEYLAGGSEDEQFLTRLTTEEATQYLEPSA